LDGLADQNFILESAVHVGSVQKIHSATEREINGGVDAASSVGP